MQGVQRICGRVVGCRRMGMQGDAGGVQQGRMCRGVQGLVAVTWCGVNVM